MDYSYSDGVIHLTKVLNVVDEFVLDFLALLKSEKITYVIMSGYVILLFGRPRITEDVDMFIQDLSESKLESLYATFQKKYWIINASTFEMFHLLYSENSAWRVAQKDEIAPNMEIKRPKDKFGVLSLTSPIKVVLNNRYELFISPLEIQLAYKLFLGSKKDLEDARYLFDIVKNDIDKSVLRSFAYELGVSNKLPYLGDPFG